MILACQIRPLHIGSNLLEFGISSLQLGQNRSLKLESIPDCGTGDPGPPREKIISRTSVLVGSLPPSSAALKEAFWFEDALTATFTVAPLLQSSRSDRKTQWMGSKRTSKTMRWRCIFTGVKCHTLHTSKKSDVRGNVFLRTNPYSCFFGLSWFTLNRSNECLDSLYHLMMILSWSINRFAGSIVGMFSNCANEK